MKFYGRISLGILAGGRAARLGGADKAFLLYENEFLCQRILNSLGARFADQLISTRGHDPRFHEMNLRAVIDGREKFSGPLAGIEALLEATESEYLLTVPVDIKYLPAETIQEWLDNPESPGMVLRDMNGLQPLLALWHVSSAKIAVTQALDKQELAVHKVIEQLNYKVANCADVQIGNLNTPRDFETK